MTTTVLSDGRILLPAEIRAAAHLQDGDCFEIVVTDQGILLRPARTTDPDQDWFWKPVWQSGEREADADLAAGRSIMFDTDAAFIQALQAAKHSDANL